MASRAQLESKLQKPYNGDMIAAISDELRRRGFEPYTLRDSQMADAKEDVEDEKILTDYQKLRYELQNATVVQLYKQLRRCHSRIADANEDCVNTEMVAIGNREQARVQYIHVELTNRGFDPYQLYHGGKLRSEKQILEDVDDGVFDEKIDPYIVQPRVYDTSKIILSDEEFNAMRDRVTDSIVSNDDSVDVDILVTKVDDIIAGFNNALPIDDGPVVEELIDEMIHEMNHDETNCDYDLSSDIDHGLGIMDVPIQTSAELKASADKSIAFRKELEGIINKFSKENGSDTPDFILANYMANSLAAFDTAVQARTKWYGGDGEQTVTRPATTAVKFMDSIEKISECIGRVKSPVAGNVIDECVGPEGVRGDYVPSAPIGNISEEQVTPGPIDEEELWATSIEDDTIKNVIDKKPVMKARTMSDDVNESFDKLHKSKPVIVRRKK